MNKSEHTERIARADLFPFIWTNKHLLIKDEYIYNHIKRMKETIDHQEILTSYDIQRIGQYYDKIMAKKYNLGDMVTKHDPKRKLRF